MKSYFFKLAILIFIAVVLLSAAHFIIAGNNTSSYVSLSPITATNPITTSAAADTSPIEPVPVKATSTPSATIKPAPPAQPFITATAYVVGNAETGEVYITHDATWVSPIASISKLFTTLVADANMDQTQQITISQQMLDVYSDSYGFNLGEQFSMSELIPAMLIELNNNLAEGLAFTYGYSTFISKMNVLAASLGLTKTHFMDASGLSNGNISDAHDLFTFAQYLYKNHQDLLAITATPSYYLATTTEHGSHVVTSTDPFDGDPHLVGGKTGRTDAAGETMMTIFNYNVAGKNYPITVVVLHSALGAREIDSERLLFQAMAIIDKQNATSTTGATN